MARRRNDGPWRRKVLEIRGAFCRSCGVYGEHKVQADHVMPRGQGGESAVENGLVLCGPWGFDCHGRKTRKELLVRPEWLDQDQIDWLAERGWVWWDEAGEVYGPGRNSFAQMQGA